MISNFHETSSSPPGTALYTLSTEKEVSTKPGKKSHRRGGKGGFWKGKRRNKGQNSDASGASDISEGGQSLSYSTSSSLQSAGESTDSSEFGNIMQVLDLKDHPDLNKGVPARGIRKTMSSHSSHSNSSSLNYSTDGESQLEGSKLLASIQGQYLLGDPEPEPEEEDEPFDMMFQPPKTPKTSRRQGGIKKKNSFSGKQPRVETTSTSKGESSLEKEQHEEATKTAPSTPVTEDEQSDEEDPVPTVNVHTSSAPPIEPSSKEKGTWKCELLEETLNDLPDAATLAKWKNLMKPYICFL